MKRSKKLAMFLAAIAIICLFIVLIQHVEPNFFVEWFVRLSFGLIALAILGLGHLATSSESKKSEEESGNLSDVNKRELGYITAVVRDYPRGNFLLGKGAIWNLMKRVIEIEPYALSKMHFNIRITSFLKDQMVLILKNNTTEPLQAIKRLLEDADVAEVYGDFGVNKYLVGLQTEVKDACYPEIMKAAKAEYEFKCKNLRPEGVTAYLEDIDKVEIFRSLNIKSALLGITEQFKVSH